MSTNPFEAMDGAEGAVMSESAVLYLSQTRPWLYFMSVLMFLGCGLMVLGGLAMMIGGAGELGSIGPAIGILYVLFAALYGVPAFFLFMQATSIGTLTAGGGPDALSEAMRYHRNFWRFVGVLTLVLMVLYCLMFGAMMTMVGSMSSGF